MLKLIYAEKRRPELSFTQFVRRWRLHAGRAMQDAPFWDPMAVYLQNDAVRGIDGTDQAYDCVGELHYPAMADVEASLASPGLGPIVADGDEFFSRLDKLHLVVKQRHLRAGHPGAFKIFMFARAPQGASRADFVGRWTERLQTLLGGDGEFARLARAVTIGGATADHDPCDLVADASFDTVAEARQGCADWLAAMAPGELCADSVAIATRSFVLYETPYDKGIPAT